MVMAIIGVLGGIAIYSFPAAQKRARDTQRLSDIDQYRSQIEIYADSKNNGLYPVRVSAVELTTLCDPSILDLSATQCVDDPKAPTKNYWYQSDSLGTKFVVWAEIEDTDTTQYFASCSNGISGKIPTTTVDGSCPVADAPTNTPPPPLPPTSTPGPTATNTPPVTNTPTPTPVSGGVTHQKSVGGGSTFSNTVSTSNVTAVSGDLYLAAVSTQQSGGPGTVSGINGLGLSWSLLRRQCGGRGILNTEVWVGQGSPSGSGIVTANLNSTPNAAVIVVSRYSGTSGTGSIVSANTLGISGACSGGTDSDSYSVSLNILNSNALSYGAVSIRQRAHTPGALYTERLEIRSGSSGATAGIAIEDRSVSVPGSVPVNGTLNSSTDWSVVGIELKP